jgi:putative exporter of polyketide antibiotics
VFYEDDESAAEVPVLCQNTDSNFSDLFKSLHENPNFSSGSFGAATVSLLFGLCLLSQVRRSSSRFRHQKTDSDEATQEIDDKLLPTVSPRSACLWTIGEALAFLTAALSALALLIHFYSREPNSGSNLLLSVSLGAAVQLCLVLWSTFGNLFFDLRHLRDLGFWSRRQKQQQPTEATISSDRPAATSIGQ